MNGKMKAVFVLGVMYAMGAVSGIAWQTYHSHHWYPSRARFADRRIKRLESQLHLSHAQEVALRGIFEKAHERATQVNEEVSWDLADIHRDSINAIHDILTPDQAREFEKLHSQAHGYTAHLPYDEEISTSTTPTKRTS